MCDSIAIGSLSASLFIQNKNRIRKDITVYYNSNIVTLQSHINWHKEFYMYTAAGKLVQ